MSTFNFADKLLLLAEITGFTHWETFPEDAPVLLDNVIVGRATEEPGQVEFTTNDRAVRRRLQKAVMDNLVEVEQRDGQVHLSIGTC